jgi:hypothetical protein
MHEKSGFLALRVRLAFDATTVSRLGHLTVRSGAESRFCLELRVGLAIELFMKMTKAIRQQAVTAERIAASSADAFVADQMKSLAQAFRTQAEIMKKNKKNKKKKK